ncbi:hypothetical protein QOZ80_2AG0151210 [Eleusine coracana subsp. coracana]|nr:hypothetical protein QOZ80_2AG0151210 [Eleusine coracana subsp. coracana]
MAKLSAGFHTPRPSSLRSSATPTARSSVGSSSSSSATKLPVIPRDLASKGVAKCLDYDDDFTLPAAASTLSPDAVTEDDDLVPLLDLPDPEVYVNAPTISDHSCVSEVAAAPADSTADTEAPLPEQISLVLSELHAARGMSPRSKRLLAALAEAATAELTPTVTSRRLRRAAFWGKVRIAVLAATVATVAAVDVALAAYLYARHVNDRYHVMPPT